MEVFVVTSFEATYNCDESSSRICGVFLNEKSAIDAMHIVRDETMEEFDDEYIEFENDKQVIIRNKGVDNYIFKIEITKTKVA